MPSVMQFDEAGLRDLLRRAIDNRGRDWARGLLIETVVKNSDAMLDWFTLGEPIARLTDVRAAAPTHVTHDTERVTHHTQPNEEIHMPVVLKFRVNEKTERLHWNQKNGETLGTCKLSPVTSGSEENQKFYEATPSGSIEFGTINKAALDSLPLGAEVYVTIEVAPKADG